MLCSAAVILEGKKRGSKTEWVEFLSPQEVWLEFWVAVNMQVNDYLILLCIIMLK